jgi:hypothetical protein
MKCKKDNQFPSESHLFAFFYLFISRFGGVSRASIACIFSLSSLNSHVSRWRLFAKQSPSCARRNFSWLIGRGMLWFSQIVLFSFGLSSSLGVVEGFARGFDGNVSKQSIIVVALECVWLRSWQWRSVSSHESLFEQQNRDLVAQQEDWGDEKRGSSWTVGLLWCQWRDELEQISTLVEAENLSRSQWIFAHLHRQTQLTMKSLWNSTGNCSIRAEVVWRLPQPATYSSMTHPRSPEIPFLTVSPNATVTREWKKYENRRTPASAMMIFDKGARRG